MEALPSAECVVDVGSGSGPLAERLDGWVGADRSIAEIGMAMSDGRRPVVQADAGMLPFASASVRAAVSSMALQIVDDLDGALAELARVLAPGGLLAVLLPTTRPMTIRQLLGYARLQLVLRQVIGYPNDEELTPDRLAASASRMGFRVTGDEQLTFWYPILDEQHVADFVDSLYLPDVDPRRVERARRVLARRIGGSLAVPLRRVVFTQTSEALTSGTGW
ncbi:MAG: class I SAM-dependent methyltransferase [Acidimicrobiales bacterium]|nr:class I SAM-dependent methyltransferase [Acidimicrobiales bacterium]